MRAMLNLGLLGLMVGLACTEESSAFGRRRHRNQCCVYAPVCCDYSQPCSCTGKVSCQALNCPGGCYAIKVGDDCICGCDETNWRGSKVAHKIPNNVEVKLSGYTTLGTFSKAIVGLHDPEDVTDPGKGHGVPSFSKTEKDKPINISSSAPEVGKIKPIMQKLRQP